jgi:hypothetical protein
MRRLENKVTARKWRSRRGTPRLAARAGMIPALAVMAVRISLALTSIVAIEIGECS